MGKLKLKKPAGGWPTVERSPVGEAADLIARKLVESDKAVAFATLEGHDGQSVGVVMVCLNPHLVDEVVRFVERLGNFQIEMPPAGPSAL